MKSKIEEIKKKALPILREAGAIRSSLFGSVVRREEKGDSDIDMLVELPKSISLLDFVGLQLKLEHALKRKVDLGEFSTIKPRLRDYILKEAIQIL